MGPATSAKQGIAFGIGGAARSQMDLNIAGGSQNRGCRILVLLIDRRDQLIEIALPHTGDAQEHGADHLFGHHTRQTREALTFEHGLELMRRAGEEHGERARFLQPLAGGGAAIIGQDIGTFDDECLALVDLRHVPLGGGEALFEPGENLGVQAQFAIERAGDGFAGDIILGGAKAAGDDDDTGACDGLTDLVRETVAIIADDTLGDHFNAELVQFSGEVEGVGIDALGRQHLTANGDNFRVH